MQQDPNSFEKKIVEAMYRKANVATCFPTDKLHESLRRVSHWVMLEKIVAALPQSLRKVESSSTFRNDCGNEKMQEMPVSDFSSSIFFGRLDFPSPTTIRP